MRFRFLAVAVLYASVAFAGPNTAALDCLMAPEMSDLQIVRGGGLVSQGEMDPPRLVVAAGENLGVKGLFVFTDDNSYFEPFPNEVSRSFAALESIPEAIKKLNTKKVDPEWRSEAGFNQARRYENADALPSRGKQAGKSRKELVTTSVADAEKMRAEAIKVQDEIDAKERQLSAAKRVLYKGFHIRLDLEGSRPAVSLPLQIWWGENLEISILREPNRGQYAAKGADSINSGDARVALTKEITRRLKATRDPYAAPDPKFEKVYELCQKTGEQSVKNTVGLVLMPQPNPVLFENGIEGSKTAPALLSK